MAREQEGPLDLAPTFLGCRIERGPQTCSANLSYVLYVTDFHSSPGAMGRGNRSPRTKKRG